MSKKDFLIVSLFLALLLYVASLRFDSERILNVINSEISKLKRTADSKEKFTENSKNAGNENDNGTLTGVTALGEDGHIHKSYLCGQEEDFNCLITEATKAIEINPENPLAYNNRAYGYLRTSQLKLAEKDLEKALELNPGHTLAVNNMALLEIKKGDFDSALFNVSRVEKMDSSIPEIYLNKGLIFAGKKQYDKAFEQFEIALEKNPELAIVYDERSRIYKKLNKEKESQADILKADQIRKNRTDESIRSNKKFDY